MAADSTQVKPWIDAATAHEWSNRWERFILDDAYKNRYCDTELGEELGWVVGPFLEGFYYGYLATHDSKWVEMLVSWADACVKHGVTEADGFMGWPKAGSGGTLSEDL